MHIINQTSYKHKCKDHKYQDKKQKNSKQTKQNID